MSTPRPSSSTSTALAIPSKAQLSLNKQAVLDEDDYTQGLSEIIARDFFPSLVHLDATNEYLSALESQDPSLINASVRRLTTLAVATPTPRTRGGVTPHVSYPSDTPLRTPRITHPDERPPKRVKYDNTLSLDQFQAKYTSEDNASFTEILDDENRKRKEKYAWAWNAQDRSAAKRTKDLDSRERMMIEAGVSSSASELQRKAITNAAFKALRLNGEPSGERERDEDEGSEEEVLRELEEEDETERAGQLVLSTSAPSKDDEPVDVMAPLKDKRPAGVHGWPFKTRNGLMFAPDADESPYHKPPVLLSNDDAKRAAPTIVHANTRLPEQSEGVEVGAGQPPSPTRSRVAAAISGTPYIPRGDSPKVHGFGYVEAEPSPSPSELGPQRVKELMTWGKLLATPRILSGASDDPADLTPSPFTIKPPNARDDLGRRLGNEAGRALTRRANLLGVAPPKRSAGTGTSGTTKDAPSGALTPRRVDMLTPAARRLLDRTKAGAGLASPVSTPARNSKLGPGHTPIGPGGAKRTGKLKDLRKVGWDSPRAAR